MSVDNPYAAPQAELTEFAAEVKGEAELANRSTRLAAAIVDGVIGLAYAIPIMYALGIWNYVNRGQNPPVGVTLASGVIGFLGFLLIHGYFLKENGQTVGKKLAGIRIADLNGGLPSFGTIILWRYLPITLVAQVPVVGSFLTLIDVLFIFRGDRRCVHDLIAGTKVVKVTKRG